MRLRLAVSGLSVALVYRVALAEPTTRPVAEAIVVEAEGTCVEQDALARRVSERLGHDTVDAALAIRVVVSDEGRAVSFVVSNADRTVAVRRFDPAPPACDELRDVLSLAIAIAIEANSEEDGRAAQMPARPSVSAKVPPRSPPSAPGSTAATVDASLSAVALLGAVPAPLVGGAAGLHVAWALGFDSDVSVWAVLPSESALGSGVVTVTLGGGRIDGCLPIFSGRWRVRTCVGTMVGVVAGQASGLRDARMGTALWVAAAGRLDLVGRLFGAFGLRVGADLVAPLLGASFTAQSTDGAAVDSVDVPEWGGALSLGPTITFP